MIPLTSTVEFRKTIPLTSTVEFRPIKGTVQKFPGKTGSSPFSLEQATAIADNFAHLLGHPQQCYQELCQKAQVLFRPAKAVFRDGRINPSRSLAGKEILWVLVIR